MTFYDTLTCHDICKPRRKPMGFLFDFLFGPSEPVNKGSQKTDTWNLSNNDYDDYYEQIHDDAFSGDLDAQAEMHDEFGDDWEGEY